MVITIHTQTEVTKKRAKAKQKYKSKYKFVAEILRQETLCSVRKLKYFARSLEVYVGKNKGYVHSK